MKIAIMHTYKSGLLENNLKYHLRLEKEIFDQFVVVVCRWNTFPDLKEDKSKNMIIEKFQEDFNSGRIHVIDHQGTHDHNEFECREMVMNSYSNHIRMWIDSDELLSGRFWHILHAERYKAYRIGHTIMSPNSVQEFRGIPYLFGRFVLIKYLKHDFLSLFAYSERGASEIEDIPDLFNVSLQAVENPDYIEAKKKWVSNYRLEPENDPISPEVKE